MEQFDEVLKLVNQARAILGCAPIPALPQGYTCSAFYCPIARALKCESSPRVGVHEDMILFGPGEYDHAKQVAEAWGTSFTEKETAHVGVPPPPALADFIHRFDNREFPQLIAYDPFEKD